jgi:hypothetical protein
LSVAGASTAARVAAMFILLLQRSTLHLDLPTAPAGCIPSKWPDGSRGHDIAAFES